MKSPSCTNKALRIFFLFSVFFHLILLVFLGRIIHNPKTDHIIEVDLKILPLTRPIRDIPLPPEHLNDMHHPATLKSQILSMPEIIQIKKNASKIRIDDYPITHKKLGDMPDSVRCEVTPVRSIIEKIKDIAIPHLPMVLTRASSDIDKTDIYKAQVLSHIKKHRKYPPAARRLGIKGTVNVDFLLYDDGSLGEIKVTKKSKYKILNNAAIESIRAGEPYPPFPSGMQEKSILIGVPITFNLVEETTLN